MESRGCSRKPGVGAGGTWGQEATAPPECRGLADRLCAPRAKATGQRWVSTWALM